MKRVLFLTVHLALVFQGSAIICRTGKHVRLSQENFTVTRCEMKNDACCMLTSRERSEKFCCAINTCAKYKGEQKCYECDENYCEEGVLLSLSIDAVQPKMMTTDTKKETPATTTGHPMGTVKVRGKHVSGQSSKFTFMDGPLLIYMIILSLLL